MWVCRRANVCVFVPQRSGKAGEEPGITSVLGCRLNTQTKMPLLRQIGNLLFAGLLTLLSGRRTFGKA
jgi:hypothetical protein